MRRRVEFGQIGWGPDVRTASGAEGAPRQAGRLTRQREFTGVGLKEDRKARLPDCRGSLGVVFGGRRRGHIFGGKARARRDHGEPQAAEGTRKAKWAAFSPRARAAATVGACFKAVPRLPPGPRT